MKRIGILTGGGDCPGLNAVIRAVVKTAKQNYGVAVVGILDGFAGLVENQTVELEDSQVSGILARGGTILGTSNRSNPFNYRFKQADGTPAAEDRSQALIENFSRLQLDGLVVIGGDGTQTAGKRLADLDLPIVGVPKTIDNDLNATDVTFGFDSALSVATEAVDRLHTTAEAHHRVMVLEVMGRYAGWIALRAGIAGGGDAIIIPEIPYEAGHICSAIRARKEKGKRFSIIVVAEGARPVGGDMVVQRTVADSPDPIRLGGIGQVIARQLELCADLESRVTVLGHLQRGGIPTAFDRWLATRFGVKAVQLLAEKHFGRMVCLRGQHIESVALNDAISDLRRVDPNGEEVQVAKAVGTSFGDEGA